MGDVMNKFTRITHRFSRPSYKHLTADEKKMVQLHEEYEMLDKSIAKTYQLGKLKFGENFRNDERFLDDFDLIFKWEERKLKINTKINGLENRTGISLNEVLKRYMDTQPSLSQSF